MDPRFGHLGLFLYKDKGPPEDANNYSRITLLSCVGKLFTALLNKRLSDMLSDNNAIGAEQAGFREGYSTIDHVYVLNALIQLFILKRKHVYCAFIDLQKAFDSINRTKLWNKLLSYNINVKVLTIIQNIYKQAKSCVGINSSTSYEFQCNVGLRQGDNLSPLLFALYINDFSDYIRKNFNGISPFAEY